MFGYKLSGVSPYFYVAKSCDDFSGMTIDWLFNPEISSQLSIGILQQCKSTYSDLFSVPVIENTDSECEGKY